MSDSFPERNPVEVLAEEFLDRYRRGENPSLTEYEARHPGLAWEIREVFPALLLVEEAGSPRAAPGSHRIPPLRGEGRVPQQMGDFRIVREIGRGGMGVVYEAFQESLGRTVALKVLPHGLLARPSALQRFRREARSVAALHHSNIVTVFGVGEHDGHHYYAMQLIRGQTLEEVLEDVRRLRRDASGLPGATRTDPDAGAAFGLLTGHFPAAPSRGEDGRGLAETLTHSGEATRSGDAGDATVADAARDGTRYHRQVARIGVQVAEALAYAHDQGVLHRDIKPANLLIDREGAVWVVDFGLAKPDGADEVSATGDVVGTIRYMAPERFDGRSDRLGDIYSLGVTLYELMTLRPAFSAGDQARLIREVLNTPPPSPRSLDRRVPRDLETIVLKAMAREPSARYATAHALAADLRRFLEDRTILARRSTGLERSWRWCRRNPVLATLLVSVAALLAYSAVSASVAASRYKAQYERAHQAETIGREMLFSAHLAEARASRLSRRPGQRFSSLRALAEAAKVRRSPELRDEAIACLALPDLDEVYRSPRPFDGALLAFDPTLGRYARLDYDGVVTVRRVADDGELRRFPSPGRIARESFVLAFSPDGLHLAVLYALADVYNLTVWDLDRVTPAWVDVGPLFRQARFTPDGKGIALWDPKGTVRLIDLGSGRIEGRWEAGEGLADIAFDPDGRRLAMSFMPYELKIRICEVPSGRVLREIAEPGQCSLAWLPDGATLAVGSSKDHRVYLHDAETGRRIGTLADQMAQGLFVRCQPVGGLLAAQSWAGQMRLWRPRTGELLLTLPAGGNVIDFHRDGSRLATVTPAHGPVIYRIAEGREFRTLVREPARRNEGLACASLHPGGRVLAVAMHDGVGLWDVDHDVAIASLSIGETTSVLFEPSGDLLVVCQRRLMRWRVSDVAGESSPIRVGPPEFLPVTGAVAIALGGRGRLLGVTQPGGATVLDLDRPGRSIWLGPQRDVRSIAVSPDGLWAATGSHHGGEGVKVWSLPEGRLVKQVTSPGGASRTLFSPDGLWLMTTVNRVSTCRLWSVGEWREGARADGSGQAFTADGRLLAVGRADGVIRLLEAGTGRVVANLEPPQLSRSGGVSFSPDGSRLYFPNDDSRSAKVWDLRSIRRQLAAIGLDWDWPALPEPEAAPRAAAPLRVVVDLGEHDFSRRQLNPNEVERLNLALEIDPNNVPDLLLRARLSGRHGKDAEAIADYTRVLTARPGDFPALQGRAELYLRHQQYEPGIADYEAATAVAPIFHRAEAHNSAAWTYVIAPSPVRDPCKALWHARKAVELGPMVAFYRNTLGITLNRLGRHREAVAELEMSLQTQTREYAVYDLFFLASSLHHLGERSRALICYERALRLQLESRLSPREIEEIKGFRAEAESELGIPTSP